MGSVVPSDAPDEVSGSIVKVVCTDISVEFSVGISGVFSFCVGSVVPSEAAGLVSGSVDPSEVSVEVSGTLVVTSGCIVEMLTFVVVSTGRYVLGGRGYVVVGEVAVFSVITEGSGSKDSVVEVIPNSIRK